MDPWLKDAERIGRAFGRSAVVMLRGFPPSPRLRRPSSPSHIEPGSFERLSAFLRHSKPGIFVFRFPEPGGPAWRLEIKWAKLQFHLKSEPKSVGNHARRVFPEGSHGAKLSRAQDF